MNKIEIWLIKIKKLKNKIKIKKKQRDLIKQTKIIQNQTPYNSLADECGKKCQINISYPKNFLKNLEIKNYYNNNNNNESYYENFLVEFIQQTSSLPITPIVQYFSEENQTTYVKPLSTILNCIYFANVIFEQNIYNNVSRSIVNLCDQNGGMVKKF